MHILRAFFLYDLLEVFLAHIVVGIGLSSLERRLHPPVCTSAGHVQAAYRWLAYCMPQFSEFQRNWESHGPLCE